MSTTLLTSLAEIESFGPCDSGWTNVQVGRDLKNKELKFSLIDCLRTNSVSDVLWLLGQRKTEIVIAVNFAEQAANSAQKYNNKYSKRAAVNAVYAADADAAADAANAANAASCANAAAANAADAAAAASYAAASYAASYAAAAAADAAAAAAADAAAVDAQREINKQLLVSCIQQYEESAAK